MFSGILQVAGDLDIGPVFNYFSILHDYYIDTKLTTITINNLIFFQTQLFRYLNKIQKKKKVT